MSAPISGKASNSWREVSVGAHYDEPAQYNEIDGSPTWITRSDTFVVLLTSTKPGCEIAHEAVDEAMLIVDAGTECEVTSGDETLAVSGEALVVLPPGRANLRCSNGGVIVRLVTARNAALAAAASNVEHYTDVGPIPPAPAAPPGGFRLRHYDLSLYDPGGENLIRPRIFRCSTLMVNCFVPFENLRPLDALRPHAHDNFEQASVALRGEWIHDIRRPWGSDGRQWRSDQHLRLDSPSTCVIPRRLVHSSRNLTKGAVLIDVFAPPREDFERAGLVLNAADYPDAVDGDEKIGRDVPSAWLTKEN